MTGPFLGGCLCGAARFEIDEFLPNISHCHCSMCRKFHGAGFATIASVSKSKFRWTTSETVLRSYRAENGTIRTFCKHCGSSLTFRSPSAPASEIEIALGTVEGNVPVRPSAHLFVGSAANWVNLSDDLPQHEGARGSALGKRYDVIATAGSDELRVVEHQYGKSLRLETSGVDAMDAALDLFGILDGELHADIEDTGWRQDRRLTVAAPILIRLETLEVELSTDGREMVLTRVAGSTHEFDELCGFIHEHWESDSHVSQRS